MDKRRKKRIVLALGFILVLALAFFGQNNVKREKIEISQEEDRPNNIENKEPDLKKEEIKAEDLESNESEEKEASSPDSQEEKEGKNREDEKKEVAKNREKEELKEVKEEKKDSSSEAKTKPVADKTKEEKKARVSMTINCQSINENIDKFNKDKLQLLPKNGILYSQANLEIKEGETAFDLLLREMKAAGIHLDFEYNPIYKSHYVKGINNIYEFDCGELSGWTYRVNGQIPNYGASSYKLKDGDKLEWIYTTNISKDIGG